MTTSHIVCTAVEGVGEVHAGDDLAALAADHADLRDGHVLMVTSKVVSKSEGRVVATGKAAALAEETDRVVARRGETTIVRTHHGLVMAAAGIDASNTEPGTLVLLPVDPDSSARSLRERLAEAGVNVAVLVTDTAGRAWRNGQTDITIGAAGIEVLRPYAGRTDQYGNFLAVTEPAIADELAAAADLVQGKLGRVPFAVVEGLSDLVLPPGSHGSGAGALVRDESLDMFGYGAREAVRAALSGPGQRRGFGAPASAEELAAALEAAAEDAGPTRVKVSVRDSRALDVHLACAADILAARLLGGAEAVLRATAVSMGWESDAQPTTDARSVSTRSGLDVLVRYRPATPYTSSDRSAPAKRV